MKKARFFVYNTNLIDKKEDVDLKDVQMSVKRRLSETDKLALALLFKSYDEDIDEIVFSSEYGEFERLKDIIEEYNTYNETSPARFSGSVHNFPVGTFCRIKKTNISYSAICADKNSISAGIIQSIISANKKILFCYSDINEKIKGVSFVISKEKTNGSFECEIEWSKGENSDEFAEIMNFIQNKKDFNSALCHIKRV